MLDKIQKRLNKVIRKKISRFQKWLHGHIMFAVWTVIHKGHYEQKQGNSRMIHLDDFCRMCERIYKYTKSQRHMEIIINFKLHIMHFFIYISSYGNLIVCVSLTHQNISSSKYMEHGLVFLNFLLSTFFYILSWI